MQYILYFLVPFSINCVGYSFIHFLPATRATTAFDVIFVPKYDNDVSKIASYSHSGNDFKTVLIAEHRNRIITFNFSQKCT